MHQGFRNLSAMMALASMLCLAPASLRSQSYVYDHPGPTYDSLYYTWYPYYTFAQPFDSALVEYTMGEVHHLHAGTKTVLFPANFKIYHEGDSSLHWATREQQADSTRYQWFIPRPGDSLGYYLNLRVTSPDGHSANNLGVHDTTLLVLQLVDSLDRSMVCDLDSIGLLPVSHPMWLPWRKIPRRPLEPKHIFERRIPDEFAGRKTALRVKALFLGDSSRDEFCRRDLLETYSYADADDVEAESMAAITDSLLKVRGLIAKDRPFTKQPLKYITRISVDTNIAHVMREIRWRQRVPSGEVKFQLKDLNWKTIWSHREKYLPPSDFLLKADFKDVPNGIYNLMTLYEDQIQDARVIQVLKP